MVDGVKVLSLFDGISCGQVALERAGATVDKYYAAEIDKHAITITQANYPNTIQLGDMTKWREWDIDFSKIDLLTAGFPCQAWSLAGKQEGDNDPRGALVHDLIDIWTHVRELNPNLKFLFENVKMKDEFMLYINNLFGVEPVLINSALVSAQNRKRYYWTNIGEEKFDLLGSNGTHVKQPEDKGILLEDIITDSLGVNSDGWHKWWVKNSEFQLSKKYSAIVNDGSNDKAICMTARQYSSWNGNFVKCGAMRGRYLVDGKRQDSKMKTAGMTEQRLEVREDGKTNTLTTVQKDNYMVTPDRYRKLTPIETERLQTLDDNYTNHVSDTQRYKAIGNGWTVDVIAHIYEGLTV